MAKILAKQLFEAFKSASKTLDDWEHYDGSQMEFNGGVTKAISAPLDLAFRKLIDASADDGNEVAENARSVVMALDEFAVEYAKFVRAAAVQAVSPRGTDQMWRAWARVKAAFELPKQTFPHSVKYLIDVANAPRDQVARMYGWMDAEGNPEVERVEEEYQTPGIHFNKETWVAPAMKRRNDEIAAQWDARKTARKSLFSAYEKADEDKTRKPAAPPSLETLLEHDAPVGQMVRLHGITEEEAYALKRDFEEEKAFKLLEANKAKPGAAAGEATTGIVDDIATTTKR